MIDFAFVRAKNELTISYRYLASMYFIIFSFNRCKADMGWKIEFITLTVRSISMNESSILHNNSTFVFLDVEYDL